MCTARHGIFVASLFAFACGRASRDHFKDNAAGFSGTGAAGASGAPGPGGSSGRGAGGAGAGVGAGGSANPGLSSVDLKGSPIYTRVQRLTNRQWENAVSDVLHFKEPHHLSERFAQPVSAGTDFDNNERNLFVAVPNALDFESGAEAAAAIATGSPDALAALYAGDDAEGFVRTFGRRAFRRPLTVEEETTYQAVFARGEELYGAGFANGAALVIRAMLQSPHFLYRTELGAAGTPLSGYEIAAKLSLWLLGTTPGDWDLDAAEAGKLDSEEGVEVAARRMLDEPRAGEVMREFHSQLVSAKSYEGVEKDVPEYDRAIQPELRLASEAFFDRVFRENFGLREILTSKQAFVGPGLAPFYGMDAPSSSLELRELGASRSGYFMQVPFLMLWGGTDGASDPIRRGLQLQKMLCAGLAPPKEPPPSLPQSMPGESTRQRITRFTEGCGDCHRVYIDPLGFAFEAFDGLGRERETDNGQPVDTSASFPFAEGIKPFADAKELMEIMAESKQVHTCYSKKVTAYALGRDLVERDRALLESLADVSLSQSLRDIVIALVRDPAFRIREEGLP